MMRKLPKQHLLGLALTLVGVGAFLGIQISDVANQQTYASWASNDDIIDDVFRAGTPSNATIINALFGDGNGNTDDTFYTQHWSGNSCNIGAMSVVNLSPGTNTIPTSLAANTVYVLDAGTYTMTGTIVFNGNCSAIVGKSAGMSTAYITTNVQGINIANRDNIIVASIALEHLVAGSDIGIYINTSTNSSVWPIGTIGRDEAIFMDSSSFVSAGGNASGNTLGIGISNNSANIYIGEPGLDNITSLIGNEIGWRIADSANVSVYNIISNASVYLGGMVENSSDILISDGTFSGNSVGVGFAGLRLSGSQNISLSGGIYVSNDGAGIWAQNVTGLTGNGLSIRSNIGGTGYGMYLESVSNISLANMTAAGNVRTNVHVTGAQNISFTNLTSTGSAEDGIQTINTTNLSILGGSFNQNTYHGIFLDAGTSGAMIDNVIANVNTLAGMYIANGANYNIVTSSTVSQNGQNGIMIYESNNNSISGSTVTDTVTSAGITLYGTSSYNNTVAQTVAGPGIVMVGGNNNLITHSIAYENNGVGMGIAGMGLSQNDSYNNTIAYSTSYNNIGYGGFGLSLDQVNNTLHDLYAYGNDTDGITIYTAGTGVNYVHDVYTYGNLDNGLYIQESENISGYNIHTYSNEMNGVRLSNTANHNYLSFVEAYDNGLNGIEVSDSATNLFENIVSFGNTNEGIYLVLKASNNTFNDLQLYNNRIGFRQSSASASKATISNTLVYNNSDAGVSLGGSSVINNAAIYNSVTGLTLQGSNNIANNVDVYNNQYGVYMTPSAMAANGKLNNVTVYNNTVGITATSSQTNTYNGLHMFDNDTPFVGTNGSDAQLTAAVPSWAIALANNLVDTGFMTCNRAVQSTNNAAQNLLVYPYCDTRGQIGGWTPTLAVQYTFFPYIYKQQQPVRYVTGSTVSTTGTVITGMFIGDFVYTGYTDFGGHINLTNEGTTYASGGFIYRYDNGPFDIEMNANTGTTKGFVVTGVNDILWDGVAGSIGSFAGLQYPLVSQYMIAGNGLKIFRGGYDIAGEGLVSNYYGQIRGIAAPVCGNNAIEPGESCDEGINNGNGGCSISCTLYTGSCTIQAVQSTGYAPLNATFSFGLSTDFVFDYIDYGDGTTGTNYTGHTYTDTGIYNIIVYEYNSLSGSITNVCGDQVEVFDYTYCGDGITQTPNSSGFIEECDDANVNDYDICTNTCTLYDPTCSISASPSTGDAPFFAGFFGTAGTGMTFQYFEHGDGTTGANAGYTYTTPGTYTITGHAVNQYSGALTNECSTQVIVAAPSLASCALLIQPGFVIDNYQTVPYQATGEILETITFTSTTTSANPIVSYQWDITSSGDWLGVGGYGSGASPYIFDNSLISAGQGTPSVELDFSAYSGVINRPWMRIMLTVTDSSGYQAEYQTPLLISDITSTGARYWIMGQTVIDNDLNGFDLSITGQMLSSIASGGNINTGYDFLWPDSGIIPHAVNIDRENDGSDEELFMYSSPYSYSNTYSTGAYTLLLGTNIGNTGTYFDMSYKTYPVACAVSCGNGSTEINEQCDDGNLNNNDGCSDICLLEVAPTCGDGVVNQQSEQCDDANSDDFDGCDSQCTINACSTTVLHTIDPMITYQRGYTNYSPNTGMTFIFTTPTTGTGYTYQRNVSGIDLSNVNSMQITGSSTGTDIQVYVDANTSPASFTGLIELEVGNGVITGYVNGTLVCNGANCQYSWISYEFNSIGGFTTQGEYNISFVSQNIANNISNPSVLLGYQVRSWPTPIEIDINIYTCDINQWLVDADAAGLFGTSALAGFTSGDFLDAYNSGTLPSMYQFYCTTGDYPWQGGVADGIVTYAVLYATGSSPVYGGQTQDFGPHTYIVDSGQNTDTIIFDRADIQTGAIASNNVGIQYMNSCVGMCGNGVIENTTGSTTSGTINYAIYADISANTGYNVNNQFGYASGGIFTFTGDINTGTAVTYQWTLSGSSLNPAITGFIVGSSTGASVSIFGNSMGYTGGSSSWIGTLTLEISDALGNVITTQGYFTIYLDGMTIIYPSADSISISGSQVTYDDYIINLAGTAGLRPPDQFYTNTDPAWTQLGVFASGGVVGFDRYGDDIYDYSTGDNPVSYNYNVTGSSITTNLSFASTGSFSLGNIYQSIVFTTTTGVNIGGGQERCDDGNSIDGDGCSSTCDLETPSCNWFTVTAQTGYAPHNFHISILPNIYTGSYTFYDIRWMTGQTSSIFGNDTFTYTGVGSYNPNIRIRPFATSQAQVLQTLTCSRPVTVLSSCGNFIVEQNEQCDDGNTSPNDGCSSQCIFEIPQTCGLSGNLVPNPGFESYTQCPTSYGQDMTGYVASWDRRGGDPDYGHMNCPYGITGFFSYLQQYPHLGSGAINILTYASNIPAGGREYISVELVTPLQIGNYYDVGFCFATHAGSHYITDSLGVLFTNNPNLYGVGFAPIAQTPQFEHTGYAQGSGWTCVSGTVLADQAYDRLILGSFQTNTGQNMIPNPIYQTGVGVSGYTVANYMIDDIFVSEKCATCGDGLQAQSEQCDLGTGNTVSCTPGYGQTCNYCSLSCTSGTVTGAYCGDTIVNANNGEQCDDGNQNNTDSCTNSCQRATPTCTLLLTPSAGSYPLNVLFSLNMNAGSSLIHMNYGDGTTGTSVTGHTYTTGGLFTPIAYIQNSSNTGLTAICPANTVITVVNGYTPVCGNAIIDTGANEVCDLGTGNTTSCTPAYGQSCSYCSLTCQVGTGQGPYCGDNIKNGNEECDGGSGCRTNCTKSSGGGTSGPTKDRCDGKDESPSYYDGKCTGTPKHTAAPVGRACKYEDEQYLTRGPFTDTYTHRALPYTEMMRASCMWRGRDTDEGQWHANPNENITVAEVLKTFVKVEGVAFDDFDIKTENARYPKPTPFADIPQDHWFAWYADYAVKKGLTDGLVTTKDGKKYLDPDRHITRNDAVKLMMITYDTINKKKISINGQSVLGDVVNASDPYYQYIRRAEALGFISGVKQKDGSYRFDGKRAITRAEFAKIVSVPFNDQLFDTSSLVLNSPVYTTIVRALDRVQGDKIDFMNTLLLNMARIPDTQFIKKFKVTKALFIQELRNAILPGLYEDASD